MRKEKIILIFVAIMVGLIVSGLGFYLFQKTKEIPTTKIKKIAVLKPTPSPKPSVFISINTPGNESVSSKAVLTISGKTVANARFIITSPIDESSGISSGDGDFSTTINLNSGQNVLMVTAIGPNGETTTQTRIVTFSIQNF